MIEVVRNGRVAEWFKAPVLKTGVPARVPWVRIPPLPPASILPYRPPLDSGGAFAGERSISPFALSRRIRRRLPGLCRAQECDARAPGNQLRRAGPLWRIPDS